MLIFRWDGAQWTEQSFRPDGQAGDWMGYDVAAEGPWVFAGAPRHAGGSTAEGVVASFVIRPLHLSVTPGSVPRNRPPTMTLDFDACGGIPGAPGLLRLVAVDGVPYFLPLHRAKFDATGHLRDSPRIPLQLQGVVLSFQAHGITPAGIADSTLVNVVFE